MKTAALKKQVLLELANELNHHGFSKTVGQAYWRNTPQGADVVHVSFIPHTNDLDITVDVAIRLDAVEDIIAACSHGGSKGDQEQVCTLGSELGNLAGTGQERWTVREPEDVREVIVSVGNMIREVAIPYFRDFSSFEPIFQVISRNDRLGWRHNPVHGLRCMRAVALAKVMGNDEAVQRVISASEQFLQGPYEFDRRQFEQFMREFETRYRSGERLPGRS